MYNPVRGGNRGGKDQFKWDQVRLMSYKDREQYLGYSTKIGYLDKGGKWRKKDWYTHIDGNDQNILQDEIRKAQQEDEKRIKKALGYKVEDQKDLPKLSKDEIRELTNKIKLQGQLQPQVEDDEYDDHMKGLGFDINQDKHRQTVSLNAQTNSYFDINPNRLEGVCIQKDEDLEKKIRKEEKKLLKQKKKYEEILKKEEKQNNGKEDKNKSEKKHKNKHKHKHDKTSDKENHQKSISESISSRSRSRSKSKQKHKRKHEKQ